MNFRKKQIVKIIFMFAMMQSSTVENNEEVAKAEELVSKLRSEIDMIEQSIEDRKKLEHADHHLILRVTGKDMDIGHFCRLSKSLYSKEQENEIRYILTIRKLQRDEVYDAKSFTDKISIIIQQYFFQNVAHVLLDDLLLTVDQVEIKADTDGSEAETDAKFNNENEQCFIDMVIDYYFENPIDMLKDILHTQMNLFLHQFEGIHNLVAIKKSDNLGNVITEEYENIKKRLSDIPIDGSFYTKLKNKDVNFGLIDFAFERLYKKILQYMKEKYDYIPEIEIEKYRAIFNTTKDKYSTIFRVRTIDVVSKFLKFFELKECKELFIKRFTDIVDCFIIDNKKYKDSQQTKYFLEYADKFCESKIVDDAIQEYFDFIWSDELRLLYSEIYERNNIPSHNLNYIKIVCDGSFMNNGEKICKILSDTKIFDEAHVYHLICIETRSVLPENVAKLCANLRFHYRLHPTVLEKIEVSMVAYPINDCSRYNNSQVFRYKHYLSTAKDTGCLSYINIIKRANETFVAIYKSDELYERASEGFFNHALHKTLTEKIGKIVYSHVMPIVDYPGSVFINIVKPVSNISTKKMIRLIQNDEMDAAFDNFTQSQSRSCLIWQFDVPILIIENLSCYLEFVQTSDCTESDDSKEFAINNVNLVSSEKTLEIDGAYNEKSYRRDYMRKMHMGQNGVLTLAHISKKQIIEFEFFRSYNSSYLSDIIARMGMREADLDQIISKFIKCKELSVKIMWQNSQKTKSYTKLEGVDIFVIFRADKTFSLHLFEAIEDGNRHLRIRDLDPIYAKICGRIRMSRTIYALENISRGIGYIQFLTKTIVNDISVHMQIYDSESKLHSIQTLRTKCLNIILQHIYNIIMFISKRTAITDKDTTFPSRLEFLALKESINEYEIHYIAEVIVNEFITALEKRVISMTIIESGGIKYNQQQSSSSDSQPMIVYDHCDDSKCLKCREGDKRHGCIIS